MGANYRAACRAKSRADFVSKLHTVEEECDESMYWMEILANLQTCNQELLLSQRNEMNEILSIVVTALKTTKRLQG